MPSSAGTLVPDDCPGPCNGAYRRALERNVSPEERPVPVPGDPVWCRGCAAGVGQHLDAVWRLYLRLGEEALAGTRPAPERVSGSGGEPSPSPMVDEADALAHWAVRWAHRVREARGFVPWTRMPYRPEAALEVALGFLAAQREWVLADAGLGLEFGVDVRRTVGRVQYLTGSTAQRIRKRAPCPRCGWQTLMHESGAEYLRCSTCGRLMSLDEYDNYEAALARSKQAQ